MKSKRAIYRKCKRWAPRSSRGERRFLPWVTFLLSARPLTQILRKICASPPKKKGWERKSALFFASPPNTQKWERPASRSIFRSQMDRGLIILHAVSGNIFLALTVGNSELPLRAGEGSIVRIVGWLAPSAKIHQSNIATVPWCIFASRSMHPTRRLRSCALSRKGRNAYRRVRGTGR